MSRPTAALALLLAACTPDVGACDPQGAAFEVVYDGFGTPAMAGQALMIQSCGGGGFCHAEGISAAERRGVPEDLTFDVRLASTSPEPRDGETARLAVHQTRVARMRGAIWAEVDSGRMPPALEEGGVVRDGEYDRFDDDGAATGPLPGLDTEDGRAILREWLACGAPVVERTIPRADSLPPVGFTVRSCQRRCVDPTWEDLHGALFELADAPDRGCAQGSCHDAEAPAAELDLSASGGLEALRDRLVGATATSVDGCAECLCGDPAALPAFASMPLITPGDPTASLLYRKVDPERSCGAAMPLSGNPLSEQALCALREWIACGAPASEADVTAAAACLDAARASCGVTVDGGAPACVEADRCANRVDPDRG